MTSNPTSCFDFGAANRPLNDGPVSGDCWEVLTDEQCLTILLVDGVGHGVLANHAANLTLSCARAMLKEQPLAPLDAVMTACHKALRGSRGAAVGLCRFNPDKRLVSYCGVGNTAFQRYPSRFGLGVSLPGTVGWIMRSLRVFESDLAPGDLYTFYTDGVSSSLRMEKYCRLPSEQAASQALSDHGKAIDDATVVFVRFTGQRGSST